MKENPNFRNNLVDMQDELRRFAYRLTANREEADDLLQETSVKALDNEDKYTPDTNFKGWMYTIMRNIFINNYRRMVREQTYIDRTENLYHLNLPPSSGSDNTESAYDLKEMRRIVHALPREYRAPFSMHVAGFKYREIAEKMGLPIGTVKSRIFFTRQRLQHELRDFVNT
jgi:RNA polymerase sigma-70 factor (ECF subfamily)